MFCAWRIVLQIGVSQIFANDDLCGTALAHCYLAWALNTLPLCHSICYHSATSIWLHPLCD